MTAIIDGADVLENRVDGLENTTFQFLELAKFDGVIDAVVLHVVRIARWFESSCSGHRVTVHVRESTITSDVVEIHRSFYNEIENEKIVLVIFIPSLEIVVPCDERNLWGVSTIFLLQRDK